ncbi:MAG TPA: Hsp20/alpha crystallin family protein [Verrucomicrobiae bacterium]|nr:Hsp20/alpha crystallin family protein [Verrucomicrobiae bacterium]
MNMLTRWNPFQEMEQLQKRMSSLLHRGGLNGEDENITFPEWAPLVDIAEDDKEYLIKVELPEVQKDDVKVTVEGGLLSISGERRTDQEHKGRKFHRVERQYGRFERNFNIPENAADGKVKAEFKDGILNVHLPKSEQARPKQINVEVA